MFLRHSTKLSIDTRPLSFECNEAFRTPVFSCFFHPVIDRINVELHEQIASLTSDLESNRFESVKRRARKLKKARLSQPIAELRERRAGGRHRPVRRLVESFSPQITQRVGHCLFGGSQYWLVQLAFGSHS